MEDRLYSLLDDLVEAKYTRQKGDILRRAALRLEQVRYQLRMAEFSFDYERELLQLQRELQQNSYVPGAYRTFYVHEPKKRLISAAPFRDRVVHPALCNVIEPLFERRFIFDSYACRQGKGTHAALNRFQHFCRRYRYVLQCDIRKFFPASAGTRFLGFRVFPTHRRLTKASISRMRRRLRRMQRAFAFRLVDSNGIRARITAWLGHAGHGQTWGLCNRLLSEYTFSRAGLD